MDWRQEMRLLPMTQKMASQTVLLQFCLTFDVISLYPIPITCAQSVLIKNKKRNDSS